MSEFRKIVRADRVQEGRAVVGRYEARQIAVVRWEGALFAFKNSCPHAGGPLSGGRLARGCITCPRHGWSFRLDTGACLTQPLYGLSQYEVREVDGWVEARPVDTEIW